jgi:lycopene cyclase domain-containing protein
VFFIGFPLMIIGILFIKKYLNGEESQKKTIKKILLALIILVIVAFSYTTPWDNYLVKNSIWYYDPVKVIGLIIGFVPIEEYTFFIVQTLLIGLFLGFVLLKKKEIEITGNSKPIGRLIPTISLLIIWIVSLITFIYGIESLTYLNLILLWALPPIMIQLIYGADILWKYRRDLFLIIAFSTIYLATADAIAISDGIWTISRNTSMGILLAGVLPIEEFTFFLVTNLLITFGLTLIIDFRSITRFNNILSKFNKVVPRIHMG